ncbi:lysostaphin resistance A-like protein [Methyloprofundus sp.]|uniref:CPBP family intramembrane glutamic endopeptidase n=1 Tax=Methyloprofundus sp. TaxID=2020875 RepID=UPI003D0EC68B
MNEPTIDPEKFFKTACYFESALILVALLLGWIADINPFEFIIFDEQAVMNGIIGTLPLCLIFIALNQLQLDSLDKIRQVLHTTLGPSLHKHHWTDLFILAAIAGVSEEILFRGVIQPWIENSWGMVVGILASSVIFGLVHAVTALYFVMATAVSIYLGLYLDYDGTRNLLTPIIIHGLYDFFAFVVILHSYRLALQKGK